MTSISYRANLSTKAFPFNAHNHGETILIPSVDQVYSRYGSPSERELDVNTPQAYYMHNVLPTQTGYMSVGYLDGFVSDFTDTIAAPVRKAVPIYVSSFSRVMIELQNLTTGLPSLYLGNPPFYSVLTKLTLPAAFTNYTNESFTYATINGVTYLYDAISATFNLVGTAAVTLQATTGLSGSTIGILAANGYCIAYTATAVAWSSTTSALDFVPSLITGAGGGNIQEVEGEILFARPTSFGFILFCSGNCVSATYTGNSRYPYKFQKIRGAGRGLTSDLVVGDDTKDFLYAITSKGLQQIYNSYAESIHSELTDFIFDPYVDVFDTSTYTFTENRMLTRREPGKLTWCSNRFLIYSYNSDITNDTLSGKGVYDYALVYDSKLERWGKLKRTHVDCFDTNNFYSLGTQGNYARFAGPDINFIEAGGNISIVLPKIADNVDSCLILGKYQFNRNKRFTITGVRAQNQFTSNNTNLRLLSSDDGQSYTYNTLGTRTNTPGQEQSLAAYNFRVDALNHSLMFTGNFDLSSIVIDGYTTGNVPP